MKKPIIGVVSSIQFNHSAVIPNLERIYVNDDYVQAVEKAGGNPIVLPVANEIDNIERQVEMCDGMVFTGGCHINPKFFNGKSNAKSGFSYLRIDEYQIKVIKKLWSLTNHLYVSVGGINFLMLYVGGLYIRIFPR